jgi:hypothetical protein
MSCTQLIGLTCRTGSSADTLKDSASARQLLQQHLDCTPLEHGSLPGVRPGPARSGAAPAVCSPHTAASTPTPRTPRARAPCTGHQAVRIQLPALCSVCWQKQTHEDSKLWRKLMLLSTWLPPPSRWVRSLTDCPRRACSHRCRLTSCAGPGAAARRPAPPARSSSTPPASAARPPAAPRLPCSCSQQH